MTTFRIAQRDRFTTINKALVNDARLSFRARGVLVWLLDKPDNWTFDSESIADKGREGRDAVRAAMKELRELGYLRQERGRGESGHWTTFTTVYERPLTEETPGRTGDWESGAGETGVGEPGVIQKTETKTEKEPPTPKGEEFDPEFLMFWAMYPRKLGRKSAYRAWKAIDRGVHGSLQVLGGAEAWVRYWRCEETEEKYIPHPATWLNDNRFLAHPALSAKGRVNLRRSTVQDSMSMMADELLDRANTRCCEIGLGAWFEANASDLRAQAISELRAGGNYLAAGEVMRHRIEAAYAQVNQ